MIDPSPKLSNLQIELLKVFSRNISEEELLDIRRMLASYFMQRASDGADKIWEERGYSNELMQEWLNQES